MRNVTATGEEAKNLFPGFLEAADKESAAAGEKKKISVVAGLCFFFLKVYELYETYKGHFETTHEKLQANLHSHSNKKRTAQDLVDMGTPGMSIIF